MASATSTAAPSGCDIPAAWCEAHHLIPWTKGGKTDLADGVLLCSHHHHRAHDDRYLHDRLPNGDIRFHAGRRPAVEPGYSGAGGASVPTVTPCLPPEESSAPS